MSERQGSDLERFGLECLLLAVPNESTEKSGSPGKALGASADWKSDCRRLSLFSKFISKHARISAQQQGRRLCWRCTLRKVLLMAFPVYVLIQVLANLLAENFRTMSTPSVPADPMLCSWLWGASSCLFLHGFSSIRCICLVRQRRHALPYLAAFCSVSALPEKYTHFLDFLGDDFVYSSCMFGPTVRQWIHAHERWEE